MTVDRSPSPLPPAPGPPTGTGSRPGPVPLAVGLTAGLLAGWATSGLPGLAAPASGGGVLALAVCLAFGAALAAWGWATSAAAVAAGGLAVVVAAAAVIGDSGWQSLTLGVVHGLLLALALLVPVLVSDVARRRRAHTRRGWDVATAEARAHQARLEQALTQERAEMAREMHDTLGHRLTLIAMRAGRLSLDTGLPQEAREELHGIRRDAAAASVELGETVHLLGRPHPEGATPDLTVSDLVERAREAGLDVRLEEAEGSQDATSPAARAAVLRVVREGLTNASRHGATGTVEVGVQRTGDQLQVQVVNPTRSEAGVSDADDDRAAGGSGLAGLDFRVRSLGGTLSAHRTAHRFVLRATLPSDARATPRHTRAEDVDLDRRRSDESWSRARRRLWWVPVAVAATGALAAGLFFVLATVLSVIGDDATAALSPGMPRAAAEDLLPRLEMLDAPRTTLPAPSSAPDAECRFYETSLSFFVRDDVVRVCLDDDRVLSVDTIPAP